MPRIVQVQYQCDGESEGCSKVPDFITGEGKAYCLCCLKELLLSMVSKRSGRISLTYTSGETTQVVEEIEKVRDSSFGVCPECGAGPLRNLQIHRRKRHGFYVRGPKAHSGVAGTGVSSESMFKEE